MVLSQVLGWVATAIFSVTYLPQIYKSFKTKSVKDISILMFIGDFLGNLIALWYATLIHQGPLQIKYMIALLAIGSYLGLYYRLRKRNDSI